MIPVLKRQRQKDNEFQASLGYIVSPVFKKPKAGNIAQVMVFA